MRKREIHRKEDENNPAMRNILKGWKGRRKNMKREKVKAKIKHLELGEIYFEENGKENKCMFMEGMRERVEGNSRA